MKKLIVTALIIFALVKAVGLGIESLKADMESNWTNNAAAQQMEVIR